MTRGIIRGIDPQRRLVVPKETLEAAGLKPGDLIQIWADINEDGLPCVVLTKHSPGCMICGKTIQDAFRPEDLVFLKDGGVRHTSGFTFICAECVSKAIKGEKK